MTDLTLVGMADPLLASAAGVAVERFIDGFTNWFPPHTFFNLSWNVRALVALLFVGVTCGSVGALVVGNRMAFFSDALSHCAFAGFCLGFLLAQVALPGAESRAEFWELVTPFMVLFGLVAGLGIAHVRLRTGLTSDTIIGVFFAASIGLVGMLQRVINNRALFGLEEFLFGAPELVSGTDLLYLAGMTLVTLAILYGIYNPLMLASFNSSLALSRRVRIGLHHYIFVALLAVVVNLSLRCVGVLLINALLIVPAATVLQVARNLWEVYWGTLVLSIATCLVGQGVCWELGNRTGVQLGTAGTIVLISVAGFFLVAGLVALTRRRPRAEPSTASAA